MKNSLKSLSLFLAGALCATVLFAVVQGDYLCGGITEAEAAEQDVEQDVEQRIKDLGITLSEPAPPVANFVHAVTSGNLVFLAGHGPLRDDGTWMLGTVGRNIGIDEGRAAARLTAISLLSSLKAEIGDLNRVKRIVKVHGMVNSDPSFTDQPKVMNGCSDLLVEIFGDRGKHARAAVGMVSLPFGIPVEIEMVVEIEK